MKVEELTYKNINVNGLNLHYIEMGTGYPLILIHGGSVTAETNWKENIQIFAEKFRCIAPDSRGHGRTVNPTGVYNYKLMADDIVALIQSMGLDKPFICGWSDGGQIALELGIHYPQLLSGLIVGGAMRENVMPMELWVNMGLNGPGDIDFDKFKESSPGFYNLLKDIHKTQGVDYWSELLLNLTKMWFDDSSYPGDNVKKINIPTLVILGDRDEYIPLNEAIRLYQYIPNAELAVVPAATHALSMGGHKELFTSIVLDFMKRKSNS